MHFRLCFFLYCSFFRKKLLPLQSIKRLLYYLFPLLLLLLSGSCSRHAHIGRALSAAEGVVERRADSALMHLGGIADIVEKSDAKSRALYGLLLTEAKYRRDEDRPDCLLPVIRSSEEWFRSEGDRLHQERSMYYHAMMLKKLGELDASVLKLKEGELMADQLSDDVFLSKYYESLVELNYLSRSYTFMLLYAKKFLRHSVAHRRMDCISRAFGEIAFSYSRLNEPRRACGAMPRRLLMRTNRRASRLRRPTAQHAHRKPTTARSGSTAVRLS